MQQLRQEKEQAAAQALQFRQDNEQLQSLMSLTESKLDEILKPSWL